MVAALGDRQDMMHLLDGCDSAFLETLLTERMLCGIPVADALPSSAVLLIHVRRALESVVLLPHGFPVRFTVFAVRKVGTAGI